MHTHTYVHCLREDHKVIPILTSLLTDNPPSPGKFGHSSGIGTKLTPFHAGEYINADDVIGFCLLTHE